MLSFTRAQRDPVRPGESQLDPALVRSTHESAQTLFVLANKDVQEAFEREKGVEQELRAVAAAVKRFSQQHQQWTRVMDKVHAALKEVGDVENWLTVIERDMAHIEGTLLLVANQQNSAAEAAASPEDIAQTEGRRQTA